MSEEHILARSISLKYADKGSYTFSKLSNEVTDAQLYALAKALNGFQADETVKVVKLTTKVIY